MKRQPHIIAHTFKAWKAADPATTGAALAYYLLFSLPTAFILALAVAGLLVSPDLVEKRLINELTILFGSQASSAIRTLITEIRQPGTSIVVSIIGLISVLWGSIGAFGQLQTSMKKIWEVKEDANPGILTVIKERVAAILIVIMLGFLLSASFMASTIVTLFGTALSKYVQNIESIINLANLGLSIMILTGMFVLLYIALPAQKIKWRAAIFGGIMTSFLFMAGKFVMGWYLASGFASSGYGAVSTITVLLVWAYITAQIFIVGAAITHVIDQKLDRA
ncbi:MAG: YihY/virulence factor BrkB family protein [Patescibacteria group bacterium]